MIRQYYAFYRLFIRRQCNAIFLSLLKISISLHFVITTIVWWYYSLCTNNDIDTSTLVAESIKSFTHRPTWFKIFFRIFRIYRWSATGTIFLIIDAWNKNNHHLQKNKPWHSYFSLEEFFLAAIRGIQLCVSSFNNYLVCISWESNESTKLIIPTAAVIILNKSNIFFVKRTSTIRGIYYTVYISVMKKNIVLLMAST